MIILNILLFLTCIINASYSGTLFKYHIKKNLVAFISPETNGNVVVLIGGLTDGLDSLPYADILIKHSGYSIVQPLITSSYSGYGGSCIQEDVHELQHLMAYLSDTRQFNSISLIGHSTGAVDALYLSLAMPRDFFRAVILQGPVSDRLYLSNTLVDFNNLFQMSKDLVEQGRGAEWMPKRADEHAAISATRFLSMTDYETLEDVFSYDSNIDRQVWENVYNHNVNLHIVLSEMDEYTLDFNQTFDYFKKIVSPQNVYVLLNADHGISNASKYTVRNTNVAGTIDVILSYCNEPIPPLYDFISNIKSIEAFQAYTINVLIYAKCSSKLSQKQFLNATRANQVISLPNRGRESGTYLYHIINNYNSLADFTLFSQASSTNPTFMISMANDQFSHNLGMVSLDGMSECQCGYMCRGNGDFSQVRDVFAIIKGQMCLKPYAMSFKAQFMVSRKRILDNPLSKYQYLQDLLMSNPPIEPPPDEKHEFIQNKVGNEIFGHVLERSWSFMFNCSDISLVKKCPAGFGDCRCVD